MMKKVLFLLISALLAMNLTAQQEIRLRSTDRAECNVSNYQQLRAIFSFSSITAEDVATVRGQFSLLSMPNTVIGGNEGDPQIPVVNELIAVPFGAQPTIRVTSYSTTDYQLSDQGIHTLVPRQPSLRKDQNPEEQPFIYNAVAYQTRGLRSEPRAMVSVEGTMRGIQLGKMTIEPVSYDPIGNVLRVFNDIEVEVSFDGADAQATKQMLFDTYSPYFDIVYKQMFNGRAILDAYDEYPDLYSTPVKMLVVTTEKYSTCEAFNNWLTWKKQKGIDVDVQLVTSTTSAADVRSLIQERYNANHPTFLVIIGDREDVTNYTEYEVSGNNYNPYVSDNEYASIDSDVYHDMFMSRMSVSTTDELANLVNKILQYEQYTMSDPSYLSNALFIAGKDSTYGYHNTYGIPTIHYAANYYFNEEHGFTNVYIYDNPDSYAGCYGKLNTGVGFANYTGHGLINGLSNPAFMTNGSYTYTVEKISNTDKYFWLMACCCLSANWGYHNNYSTELNVSVGEALIRSDKGAFGYIGSVPETYWSEDYYFGVGATSTYGQMPTQEQTSTGVYDGMFMDDSWNTLNSMPFLGNVAVTYSHANGYYHSTNDEYYWRAYQCLGDGSVMPYLVKPEANTVSHADNLLIGTPTFTVNADAGSYVSITIDNEIIGVAQVPEEGTVDVPIAGIAAPGTAMIVVTRQQRQPYIGSITIEGIGEPFDITCNSTEHGTVSAPEQAYAGALVTLTATPDAGYCLDSWEVRDANDDFVSVTGNQFIMPEGNVTVNATFVQGYAVNLASVMNGSISADPIFAKPGTSITLTATPETGYEFNSWVVFKTGDLSTMVEVNNNSFILPDYDVTVSAIFLNSQSGGEVTIGSGNNSSENLPVNVFYKLSTTQQIYTAAELGMAGVITAISFNYKGTASSGARNIDIYLSHTNRTTLSTSWVGQQTTDMVYSGIQTFASAGWCTITLDTPFEYDGESNLLLTVDDNTNGYEVSSKMYFYTYYTGTSRATYKYDDRYNVDPVNPQTSSSYKPTTSNYNSQVIFTKVTPAYLSISSNALSGFNYAVNEGPSEAQSVAIIGANMQDDLIVTAPMGYEVSQTQAGIYTTTLTLSPIDGSLQEMVYVRLAAGLDEGFYSGTMDIASGSTSASLSLSGEVSTGSVPLVPYTFIGTTSPSWNEASNWLGNEVPGEGAAVVIDGICVLDVDANLASLTVNEGKSITVPNGKTLTAEAITTTDASQLVVADGGQLLGNVGGVLATVQRIIVGYGSDNSVTTGWNCVASPLKGSISPTAVGNMITETTYDLFRFDQSADMEWLNYKAENFDLFPGMGYLYANSEDVTLSFMGSLYEGDGTVSLIHDADAHFPGWNLVGNPFTHTAYIDRPYYTINEDGSEIISVMGNTVEVTEGVFVVAEAENETVTFSTEAPGSKGATLVVNITQNRGTVIDRAIVRFSERSTLPKFMLNESHTKVYISQDNKDYAVVSVSENNVVPVSFKAAKNGTYTMNFSTEEVTFSYLHLIDNLTGMDVDILAEPDYTFEARTSDIASRFLLRFIPKDDSSSSSLNDDFAYYFNDKWVIANEGKATLQVVDALGRILSSEQINGCCEKQINAANGVYLLRLINGNQSKVQRIVVR